MNQLTKFREGDRVVRRLIFPNETSRSGIVTKVYKSHIDYLHQFTFLYSVLWDGDTEETTGYMEIANGLDFESK